MKKIYLDNAASTMVNSEVLNEMLPYFTEKYGNSNSLHEFGRTANAGLDLARERIAKAINCQSNEIYFTSGATESNNWAIKGIAESYMDKGKHIIVSCIEHPSIIEPCKYLEKHGFKVTYLPVDKNGIVSLADLLHNIDKETILVSIMSANNEMGTIQHLKAIAQTTKEKGVLFHTDATQGIGAFNIDVQELGVDMLTISGHKIGGPKGIGALYIKNGIGIEPLLHGGHQERLRRGGTSNVPGAVGLGKAVEVATRDITINAQKLKKIRDYFIKQVLDRIEYTKLNGHPIQRLANNANISFGMIEGESIMLMLDLEGISVSTGSACSLGVVEPSNILLAMGLSENLAKGAVRFTFSKNITKSDVDYVVEKLEAIVKKLRSYSPLSKSKFDEFKNEKKGE